MSTVEERVKVIIAKQLQLEVGKVKNDAYLVSDLGVDSLDSVELVIALEEAFEIEIQDEDAQRLVAVQQVIDYIQKNQKESSVDP